MRHRARRLPPAGILLMLGVLGAPRLMGITGVVTSLPAKHISIVICTTQNPEAPPGTHYAASIFNEIAPIVAPSAPPNYPA